MAWKSREGKLPPSSYYAQILAYLAQAYPEAKIDMASVEVLKPAWDALWLDGRTAEIAAKSTCSCDGKRITASPALVVPKLPKGAVRGPTGVERGQLFEPSSIRGSVAVESLRRQSGAIQKQIERLAQQAGRIVESASKRRSAEKRAPLAQQLEQRRAEIQSKIDQARAIETQIEALRQQLGSAARIISRAPSVGEPAIPKLPDLPAAPPPKATKPRKEKKERPAKPKKERAPKPAAKEGTKKPAGKASPEVLPTEQQDAKILEGIKQLLPGLAEGIAQKLKSGG